MKTLIIIPVYNEEKTLQAVIKDLENHGYKNIVVINDGSTDESAQIANQAKISVLTHVINRGLGASLETGLEYARNVRTDIVVTFDADGQHKARDLDKLLSPIYANKADVVIGSRMLNPKKMPTDRLVLNYFANWLTLFLYGFWSTDSQSGLRAFNKKAIDKIRTKTDRMEISSEFLKETGRNKLRYTEVPIEPIYTEYSRQSGQNNWNSLNIGIKMLIRLFR